jgi:hypothetical protein
MTCSRPPDDPTPGQYTHSPERAEHALSDYYSNGDFFVGIIRFGTAVSHTMYRSPWTRPDCARAAWRQSIIEDEDMI